MGKSVLAHEAGSFPLRSRDVHRIPTDILQRSTNFKPSTVIRSGLLATLAIAIINICTIIWANAAHGTSTNGSIILYEGSCSKASGWNTALHLVINIFSMLLLVSSSYAMQCLISPTRNNIDQAHAQGKWLDVGVPSLRNLSHVHWRRSLLWGGLAMSSVLIAFLYNAMIVQSVDTNDYYALFADEAFLNNGTYDRVTEHYHWQDEAHTQNFSSHFHPYTWTDRVNESVTIANIQAAASHYQPLSNKECIKTYSQQVTSGIRNLILVTSPQNNSDITAQNLVQNGSLHFALPVRTNWAAVKTDLQYAKFAPFQWICSVLQTSPAQCQPGSIDPATWNVNGFAIQRCLAEKVAQRCQLALDPTVGIIVIICNAIKLLCLLLTCLELREKTLMVQGDVMESFLLHPDPHTENLPLLTKSNLNRFTSRSFILRHNITPTQRYSPIPHRASLAAGLPRTLSLFLLHFILAIVTSTLKYLADQSLAAHGANNIYSFQDFGFGSTNPLALFSLPPASTITATLLLANTPQIYLSLLYLTYNSFYTCLTQEKEWATFAQKHSHLRVSQPREGQKSTYFLSLPYRYAVPLIISAGLMHYLASQSIFFARVRSFSPNGNLDERNSVTGCGYSVMPIICLLFVAAVTAVVTTCLGNRRLPKTGMPFAGHCSAVIGAACHVVGRDGHGGVSDGIDDEDGGMGGRGRGNVEGFRERKDLIAKPIQWGIVGEDEDGIVRCGFSAGEIGALAEGQAVR